MIRHEICLHVYVMRRIHLGHNTGTFTACKYCRYFSRSMSGVTGMLRGVANADEGTVGMACSIGPALTHMWYPGSWVIPVADMPSGGWGRNAVMTAFVFRLLSSQCLSESDFPMRLSIENPVLREGGWLDFCDCVMAGEGIAVRPADRQIPWPMPLWPGGRHVTGSPSGAVKTRRSSACCGGNSGMDGGGTGAAMYGWNGRACWWVAAAKKAGWWRCCCTIGPKYGSRNAAIECIPASGKLRLNLLRRRKKLPLSNMSSLAGSSVQ